MFFLIFFYFSKILLQWTRSLPIVVIIVAAKMTALGQFQLLKALSPVMVTPCPAASDTTYLKIKQTDENSHTFQFEHSVTSR